jgi:hypothetical protein
MKKFSAVLLTLGLTAIFSISVPPIGVAQAKSEKNFTIDVACNGNTLALNPADPADPIYPAGTLPAGVTTSNPSAPGGLGTWRCLFASLAEPPLIGAITYYFALVENGEENMLLVQGLNSHLFPGSVPRVHPIVGGTGKYNGASGEVREEVLGTNASGCFNLRFQFSLKKKPK